MYGDVKPQNARRRGSSPPQPCRRLIRLNLARPPPDDTDGTTGSDLARASWLYRAASAAGTRAVAGCAGDRGGADRGLGGARAACDGGAPDHVAPAARGADVGR